MSIGYQIMDGIKRPSLDMIKALGDIPVPILGDSMDRSSAISSEIQPINSARLAGCAYTVHVPAGDNLLLYYAIDQAYPGDIIVVDGGGFTERALCGEIMVTYAMKRGLAGLVIDGAIRDKMELSRMKIPVFAKSSSPNGPNKNGPGKINVPVSVGGKIVCPGDIIIGDENGIITINPKEATQVLKTAHKLMEKEKMILDDIERNGHLDLRWMYQKIEHEMQ